MQDRFGICRKGTSMFKPEAPMYYKYYVYCKDHGRDRVERYEHISDAALRWLHVGGHVTDEFGQEIQGFVLQDVLKSKGYA